MAFNSFHFLIFLPVVFLVYFTLPVRARLSWLLAAGLYFYMVWRPPYLLLMLAAIGVAYTGGRALDRTTDVRRRRMILAACVGVLLGVLFVFKYFNFFSASLARSLAFLGVTSNAPHLELLLPLGISFYTFQLVGYVIEVFRGTSPAERRLDRFTLFITFFPQLVAGPIERARDLVPQLRPAHFEYARTVSGLRLIAWGLFKKVVVADRIAPFVQMVYGNPTDYSGVSMIVATVGFAFQVYCDFSGYTDIAIGAARLFDISLTQNFKQPYFAVSISDFWKRWHITLSTWLTDFVYTPLTRSRWLPLPWYPKLLLCLMLTFLVSGLWHGAAWHFLLWGAMHGAFLVGSFVTQRQRKAFVRLIRLDRVPALHAGVRIVITFALVCLSYIFFRAEQVTDAVYIVTHLFTGVPAFVSNLVAGRWVEAADAALFGKATAEFTVALAGVLIVLIADSAGRWQWITPRLSERPMIVRWATYSAVVLAIAVLGAFYDQQYTFIYFAF